MCCEKNPLLLGRGCRAQRLYILVILQPPYTIRKFGKIAIYVILLLLTVKTVGTCKKKATQSTLVSFGRLISTRVVASGARWVSKSRVRLRQAAATQQLCARWDEGRN